MDEKVISAEVSFIPIETNNYIEDVNEVLQIIKNAGVQYEINSFSTIVFGEKTKVFGLLRTIFDAMDVNSKFILVAKISNTCGCEIKN
ncbi:hypothetical protein D9V84_00360 [Bacteroidetes/Chlorobi group bacterium Naka2016]|jgi:uncharacterized protein YqgV (UPF0045/DUF77 family)|nr:MAG: hypothetical protein D9V84_00360 [Bacteroidetes/Chlorobi group bacterium Naka2016]